MSQTDFSVGIGIKSLLQKRIERGSAFVRRFVEADNMTIKRRHRGGNLLLEHVRSQLHEGIIESQPVMGSTH